MPAAVDVLEAHRAAVAFFGAVIHKDGTPAPSANTGLITSAMAFTRETGIEIAHGTHVIAIESDVLGDVVIGDCLLVDDDVYLVRGPGAGDLAVRHIQVVPEKS